MNLRVCVNSRVRRVLPLVAGCCVRQLFFGVEARKADQMAEQKVEMVMVIIRGNYAGSNSYGGERKRLSQFGFRNWRS